MVAQGTFAETIGHYVSNKSDGARKGYRSTGKYSHDANFFHGCERIFENWTTV
jgi:hypothetical protein